MVFNETIGYGLLGLLLLAAIVSMFFFNKIKRAYVDWYLVHTVKQLGHDIMRNVVLPDGMDGTVCIDNIVLMPDRILLVSVGRYQGAVFASENIDVWTQVVGKRSYKFNNPLLKLEQDIAAVRTHEPKIRVDGILVFSADVNFPKGKPDNVISVTEAKRRFANVGDKNINPEYLDAWNKIKNKSLD
ncbi:MAG TPA: NERD domain-containing protein [Gammaproteobacteria bacterium]|nr:NERD domain-containing protein [Gammaproteobacteria bacterium]